jgi:hypothetical protein
VIKIVNSKFLRKGKAYILFVTLHTAIVPLLQQLITKLILLVPVIADINILPNLPPVLHELHIRAPYFARSRVKQIFNLLKYPPPSNTEDDAVAQVTRAWTDWWDQTEWALQPNGQRPKWNSIARTGQIWTKFGEAARYPSGHPHVFCLRCGSVLQHPSVGSIGTKHLLNYYDSNTCKNTVTCVYT